MDKQNQIRRLSQALLISGSLNIAILTIFFYWLIKEAPPTPYCELKPANRKEQQIPLAVEPSSAEVIRLFRTLSLEQLIARLLNTQLVENGFTQRDLALSSLISFHDFDFTRSLKGLPLPDQQRKIPFGRDSKGNNVYIIVYPNLSEKHFQTIVDFTRLEKWPLTSRGLFRILRKRGLENDPSLIDAFYLTPEFLSVETLFNRSDIQVTKQEVLAVLLQGSWNMLSTFSEQQHRAQDLSPAKRQRFLMDYINKKSMASLTLLLKTDFAFASKKLDDNQVLAILNLMLEHSPAGEKFALAILKSPRSDTVRLMAANRLFEFAGEPKPEKNKYAAALARFVPEAKVPLAQTPPPQEKPKKIIPTKPNKPIAQAAPSKVKKASPPMRPTRTYIVQEGDSLWKIAKRFKIEISAIKKLNNLKSDFLKPGITLKIP